MNRDRLVRLAERRARLVERAGADREALVAILGRGDALAGSAMGVAEGARRLFAELRRQPALVAGLVALLIALRPRRALGWIVKGWSAWRLYRGAHRWWRRASDAGFLGVR